MPLPAAVSSQVHALMGGVVEHRGTDAYDLSDDTKLLQRLYALNVVRLEGQEPDVTLWTVRMTVHAYASVALAKSYSHWPRACRCICPVAHSHTRPCMRRVGADAYTAVDVSVYGHVYMEPYMPYMQPWVHGLWNQRRATHS
jgi:hypothetical protein